MPLFSQRDSMIHLHLFRWNRSTLPVVFRCHVLIWLVNVVCKRCAGRWGRGAPRDRGVDDPGEHMEMLNEYDVCQDNKGREFVDVIVLTFISLQFNQDPFFFVLVASPSIVNDSQKRVKTQNENPVFLCRSLFYHASIKRSINWLQTKLVNLISTPGTRHLFLCPSSHLGQAVAEV